MDSLEAAARARGGRAPVLSAEQVAEAHRLIEMEVPLSAVARRFGVTRATVYRYFEKESRGTLQADVAAMKLELARLCQWRDQMMASAPSGAQAPR